MLTIVGMPFSTFTRTMRMALTHLNVPYELVQASPHSALAYKYNPFGRVPSVLDKDRVLFETAAIREYIDCQYSSSLTPAELDPRLKMHQLISVLSDYVFHTVILGVNKRRDALPEGQDDKMKKPLERAGQVLQAFDSMIPYTPFLCGRLSWADYYVFPVADDLFHAHDAPYFKEKLPRLMHWYTGFKEREEVRATYAGTVADQRSSI